MLCAALWTFRLVSQNAKWFASCTFPDLVFAMSCSVWEAAQVLQVKQIAAWLGGLGRDVCWIHQLLQALMMYDGVAMGGAEGTVLIARSIAWQ